MVRTRRMAAEAEPEKSQDAPGPSAKNISEASIKNTRRDRKTAVKAKSESEEGDNDLSAPSKKRGKLENIKNDEYQFKLQAQAQMSFAIDLLKEITRQKPEAMACSPFSLSASLAILHAGARGRTEEEIGSLLKAKFDLQDDQIHSYFSYLLKTFSDVNFRSPEYNPIQPVELKSANKLFVKNGFEMLDSFKDLNKDSYQGMIEQVDLSDKKKLANHINRWANKTTRGLIKNVVFESEISQDVPMFLLNATCFVGFWLKKFNKEHTKEGDFIIHDKERKKVDFMHKDASYGDFQYHETDDLQVLRMPYKENTFAAYTILPKTHRSIENLLKDFDGSKILDLLTQTKDAQCGNVKVDIKYPKFKVTADLNLDEILKPLGMETAFDVSKADFTGISTDVSLHVGNSQQKAYIAMDEKGTVAVAATKVLIMCGCCMYDTYRKVQFYADHPFSYFIVHDPTMTILFAGTFT
ncbi:hypothetical protein L596_022044 [Steinernema carpocapsae]|uniref:Serpin domain-containing protein n=1 Tax=Steinernema carpocapsae TaxID=34508 RepID=A0A4U5MKN4_STECR|nr:hypothetical protein L596_022044 [Steinernema carpocapsae]